jgi:hypothetical protein
MHFHTIGRRCWCGYLTVPNRFHERDSRGNVIGHKGESQYLAWLASDEKPAHVNPPVMAEVRGDHGIPVEGVTDDDHGVVTQPESGNKTCNTCGEVVTRRKVCNKCRQAAYRRRHEEPS